MKYLLGLSENCNGFPTIVPRAAQDQHYSFGIASYAQENNEALMYKYLCKGDDYIWEPNRLLSDKESGSATFISCYEIFSYLPEEESIQPFAFHYAAKDWVFACRAELHENFRNEFPQHALSLFHPIGRSAEEYICCWLLHQIFTHNVSSLEELTWNVLHNYLQQLNAFGSIDMLIYDGHDLVAYHDKHAKQPLYTIYHAPPHKQQELDFEYVKFTFDHLNSNHTRVFFSHLKPKDAENHVREMYPSQLMVIRGSECLWDSHNQKAAVIESLASIEEKFDEDKPPISESNPLVLFHLEMTPLLPLKNNMLMNPSFVSIITDKNDQHPEFYSVIHESIYEYDAPINISKHQFRLQPVHDVYQSLLSFKLLSSVNCQYNNFTGVFGNAATRIDISESYTALKITGVSLVSVNTTPFNMMSLSRQRWVLPLSWMPWDHTMLQAYLVPPELPESELLELREYALSFVKRNNNCLLSILDDMNHTINRDYTYLSGSTTLSTTPFTVYLTRQGVCQDFANLFICLARLLNIPARYRIGYIYTGGEYENKEQGDATHAWVEIFFPGSGWMGFDPTNCCHESKNHIRVATGRNYRDATPTSGTIYSGGGGERLATYVQVVKLTPEFVHEIIMKNY